MESAKIRIETAIRLQLNKISICAFDHLHHHRVLIKQRKDAFLNLR